MLALFVLEEAAAIHLQTAIRTLELLPLLSIDLLTVLLVVLPALGVELLTVVSMIFCMSPPWDMLIHTVEPFNPISLTGPELVQ